MKLMIQIPCFNEEATLGKVLAGIPDRIDGVDEIEIQVVDDGSTDGTVKVAQKFGVHHILRIGSNKGLGNAFKVGVENALAQGADILVNTDGDNQYPGENIPDLIRPILKHRAGIVLGNRQTSKIKHFSRIKRILQSIGSGLIRRLAGVDAPDAVTGFRAYSRNSLLNLNITSDFSYTIDTLIQAGKKQIKVVSVDIEVNPPERPSRLFGSLVEFIYKSLGVLINVYVAYEPQTTFFWIGSFFLAVGLYPMIRFVYFYVLGDGSGHIQSLIAGSIFIIVGFIMYGLAVNGILFSRQRKLAEDIINRLKKIQYEDD